MEMIQGIREIFTHELKHRNLAPSILPEEHIQLRRRWYTTPCTDHSGKKYMFKGLLAASEKYRLEREIRFNRFLKKIQIYKNLNTQKLAHSKISKNSTWILLEFIPGKPCGLYFDFTQGADNKAYIEQFAHNITELQKIPASNAKKIDATLRTRLAPYYISQLEGFRSEIMEVIPQKTYNIAIQKILENTELFKKNLVLAHGDTALSNHILGTDKKIYLMDWEQCHVDNIAFDPCFLWIQTWKNHSWRKDFLKEYAKKIENVPLFKKLIPIMMLYFSLREIGLWVRSKHDKRSWSVIEGKKTALIDPRKIQNRQALVSHKKTLSRSLARPLSFLQ